MRDQLVNKRDISTGCMAVTNGTEEEELIKWIIHIGAFTTSLQGWWGGELLAELQAS